MVGLMTSSELIDAVKRRAFLPNTQYALDDQDILNFINEELNDAVVPLIMSMHEEYFLKTASVPLVINQQSYKIPYRAIGMKLRDVKYTDENNNLYRMTRVNPSERDYFTNGEVFKPVAFYLQGDELTLVNQVGQIVTGALQLMYYFKPNELVKENRVGKIKSINTTTGEIVLESFPSQFAVGTLVDVLEAAFGNRTLNFDVSLQNVDSITKTVTLNPTDIPNSLRVGDYIASAGECIIPQIPVEMHSILAERAAARCLASLGDTQGVQTSNAKISEMEVKATVMLDNRTEGQPQKVNNLGGMMRRSRIARRRFFK